MRRYAGNNKPQKRQSIFRSDAELAVEAKEAGTNTAALPEKALKEELRERGWQKRREEHREAIEAHNQFVQEHGLLSDNGAISDAPIRRLQKSSSAHAEGNALSRCCAIRSCL
jgi:post-segregation antitoxin (ccd killing protein)